MIRVYIALGLVALLALGAWRLRVVSVQDGINQCIAEQQKANKEQDAALLLELKAQIDKANKARDEALSELNNIRNQPPIVVTKHETEIIERNVCRSFDSDFIRLLDSTSATSAENGAGGS